MIASIENSNNILENKSDASWSEKFHDISDAIPRLIEKLLHEDLTIESFVQSGLLQKETLVYGTVNFDIHTLGRDSFVSSHISVLPEEFIEVLKKKITEVISQKIENLSLTGSCTVSDLSIDLKLLPYQEKFIARENDKLPFEITEEVPIREVIKHF